jgi:glycosyltransferase involved in cell wall biosynthesis
MTDISVIIPTFNRWPMLTEAVASVMGQREVDFELIIVDDGSTDETAERLPALAEQLATDHRVRIIRTANCGPAAARNRGVAVASSPFVAFLDSDDVWHSGKLQQQLGYMRHNPGCHLSQTEEIWLRRGIRVNPGRRHLKRAGNFFFDSLHTCLVSPSAAMMRTSTFRELGGFDEDMRAAEDYDLWLRLLLAYEVGLISKPLVTRRAGHPGQLSAVVPALDRFRIFALLKLLLRKDLSQLQRDSVCDTLIEKCGIYGHGTARRGNTDEAQWIETLATMSDKAWRRVGDSTLENAVYRMRINLTCSKPQLALGD